MSVSNNAEQSLCFRQNFIIDIEGLEVLAPSLKELDFYDNKISHMRGLNSLVNLELVIRGRNI